MLQQIPKPEPGTLNSSFQIHTYPFGGDWRWHVLVDGHGYAHGHATTKAAARTCAQAYLQRKCRTCGCTLSHACPGGCYWIEPNLCSKCDPSISCSSSSSSSPAPDLTPS
ncbi:MAG: hypothetical protein JWR19_2921 [Pedosphaera sp.]|nr:hypothetical protein [Pedosphaera sp.]